ncbi:MAG TPA: ABC transporter permease [Puia sp.]|nr:ABC transporter permease [Puia sp.]
MLKNYLVTAWRNTRNYKAAGIINIIGLSVGMAAAVLIFIWVQNELNFDNYHKEESRIFHITMGHKRDSKKFAGTPWTLADAVNRQIPEIEKSVRLYIPLGNNNPVLDINDNYYREKQLAFVDASWFSVFHYDFIEGNADAFNQNPNSIILTETLAKKYFLQNAAHGTKNALGQVIYIDTALYKVVGVIKDNPANSSFQYNIIIPIDAYLKTQPSNAWTSWMAFMFQTFVKIKKGASINHVEQEINEILLHQDQLRSVAFNNGSKDTISANLGLLRNLHFDDSFGTNTFKQGNKQVVLIFPILGLLLLIIACVNYVNLTTAKASKYSKEVSIKKIIGAGRKDLFAQFMTESTITGIIALVVTLILIKISLPWFNRFTERNFVLSFSSFTIWTTMLGALVTTILLTGIYPALLLSSFKPLNVLKGINVLKTKNTSLRKTLVVFQFTVAIALAISTFIILQQLHFILSNNEGYDRSRIFSFSFPKDWNKNNYHANKADFINMVKNELMKHPAVQLVTVSDGPIFNLPLSMGGIADWTGRDKNDQALITPLSVDSDFRKIFHLTLKEGRWFDPNSISDKHNYILNETAVAEFGLKKPYIGQYFSLLGDSGQIIGIVKDFHFRDYRQKIDAAILFNNPGLRTMFLVQANGANISRALTDAGQIWKKFFPSDPFEYNFLDEEFAQMYKDDIKTSGLFGAFSGIAICISCLGLFGLVSFMAEQRTKEIGIRKVLGASAIRITIMLSGDFVKVVLIGFVIASPLAWWAINKWLQNFAYKIQVSWWVFAGAGCVAIVIALATVSFQAIKAALANPVKSLRTE